MTKNQLKGLVIAAFLAIVVCCVQPGGNNSSNNTGNTGGKKLSAVQACDAASVWISSPSGPAEVANDGGKSFCDFQQFSWQWFLSMMNTPGGTGDRAFQDEKNFPLFLGGDVKNPQGSCGESTAQSRLFVRTMKDDDGPGDDFTLPERINQAGKSDAATIYDQNGNVVYYEVRFSRSQCTTPQPVAPATPAANSNASPAPTPAPQMFPAGTVELKVSYRVITEADKPYYVWINADINGDGTVGTDEMLGMVGFHFVISTPDHPEFIWASFEHMQNAPECTAAANASAKYSFTSAKCAAELPNSVGSDCAFNSAPTGVNLKGPPTQICQVYHAGSSTNPVDPQNDNAKAIDQLNAQLTGPNGLIAKNAAASSQLGVLQNYQLIGSIWLLDPKQPSQMPGKPTTDESNQIGSLQLANPTMETVFQQFTVAANGDAEPVAYTGSSNLQPAANCFFCHRYVPGNNVGVSHIFSQILGKK